MVFRQFVLYECCLKVCRFLKIFFQWNEETVCVAFIYHAAEVYALLIARVSWCSIFRNRFWIVVFRVGDRFLLTFTSFIISSMTSLIFVSAAAIFFFASIISLISLFGGVAFRGRLSFPSLILLFSLFALHDLYPVLQWHLLCGMSFFCRFLHAWKLGV